MRSSEKCVSRRSRRRLRTPSLRVAEGAPERQAYLGLRPDFPLKGPPSPPPPGWPVKTGGQRLQCPFGGREGPDPAGYVLLIGLFSVC